LSRVKNLKGNEKSYKLNLVKIFYLYDFFIIRVLH